MINNTINKRLTIVGHCVRPKPQFWFRFNTETEPQNDRYFREDTATSKTPFQDFFVFGISSISSFSKIISPRSGKTQEKQENISRKRKNFLPKKFWIPYRLR